MISPEEFINRWNKDVYPLIKYDVNVIDSFIIPDDDKKFLTVAGLPDSAAPFLSFEPSKKGAVRFTDKNDVDLSFSKYIYFGFTGNGDPICVVEKSGEMVYLDHENDFFEVLINSSVLQFAETILEYSEFINKIKKANGRKAFLEKDAPSDLLGSIIDTFNRIDLRSLGEKCFWREELDLYNQKR